MKGSLERAHHFIISNVTIKDCVRILASGEKSPLFRCYFVKKLVT